MPVPQSIDTSRLVLRQFVADDWKTLHEHYSDLECTRFTFGRALTEGESWGKGFAAEAARGVQRVALEHFGGPPISLIGAQNMPSIKVALSVGASLEQEILFRGNPFHVYRHPASLTQ